MCPSPKANTFGTGGSAKLRRHILTHRKSQVKSSVWALKHPQGLMIVAVEHSKSGQSEQSIQRSLALRKPVTAQCADSRALRTQLCRGDHLGYKRPPG